MRRVLEDEAYPLPESLELVRLVWRVNHALERLSVRMEKEIGISAPQRMMIRFIGKYPEITPGRLADALHLDPGTVSATLARLERKRLIQRRRDSRDKRRVIVGLTDAGRALDRPASGTFEQAAAILLTRTPRRDIDAARSFLIMLAELLDDEAARPVAAESAVQ